MPTFPVSVIPRLDTNPDISDEVLCQRLIRMARFEAEYLDMTAEESTISPTVITISPSGPSSRGRHWFGRMLDRVQTGSGKGRAPH